MNKQHDQSHDPALLNQVVDALDQSIEHLDGRTLSRLNQARHHALATPARPRFVNAAWLKAGALAVILLGLVNGWMMFTASEFQTLPTDDFELVMVNDDFELMRDLDFFAWMIEQERAQ